METQHSRFREHVPRGRSTSCSAPGADAQRTQKCAKALKRRRWGALHVCIAWKIYHHKQLKRIQQKSTRHRADVTPEGPSQPQSDRGCTDQAAAGGRCRSDPNPPSPCRLRSKNLCWRDKQEGRQTLGGRTRGPGSPGGRWPLRCDGFSTARRVLVSSTPSPHVHAAELPLARPSIRAGHLPGSARSFVPFPGARTHPSWESMWDVYRRSGQRSAFEHPGHPHRLAAAPQGHKLDFYPFCGPPPHFPRMMETGYLRRGEAPNCSTHQPPPPRFLAAAYLGH